MHPLGGQQRKALRPDRTASAGRTRRACRCRCGRRARRRWPGCRRAGRDTAAPGDGSRDRTACGVHGLARSCAVRYRVCASHLGERRTSTDLGHSAREAAARRGRPAPPASVSRPSARLRCGKRPKRRDDVAVHRAPISGCSSSPVSRVMGLEQRHADGPGRPGPRSARTAGRRSCAGSARRAGRGRASTASRGDAAGQRIGGEGVRRAAVEVARELVEQDQQRQRAVGGLDPRRRTRRARRRGGRARTAAGWRRRRRRPSRTILRPGGAPEIR